MKKLIFLSLAWLSIGLTSCDLDVYPEDAISSETIATTSDGLLNVVNGNYALIKDRLPFNGTTDDNNGYIRQFYQMSDFASDDIVCGQKTEDPFYYSFTLTHSPDQTNTRFFWYVSYKIINGANTAIQIGEGIKDADATVQQLVGECYFLRAFSTFNLLRFYAMPYSHDPNALGVIIRTDPSEQGTKERATVAECYAQIIDDLEKGAELMTQNRGPQYASKEAAWALLSRVFLYMEDNDKAIEYATKVIDSGAYALEGPDGFQQLFANAASSSESIWIVAMTTLDNRGKFGSVASMLYSDGNSGWGEEFATPSYRALLGEHPEDARHHYIVPLGDGSGGIAKKNGVETYYITKFSFQDGDPNLASPVMLRLSEMYLNRAEAYAKKGDIASALADVDAIRSQRGLDNALYNGSLPSGMSALDVVLKERRLELAFEGHRAFDVYRNKLTMNREYWGYHIPGLTESEIDLSTVPTGKEGTIVAPTSPRIIYFIPIDEVLANPACEQNP